MQDKNKELALYEVSLELQQGERGGIDTQYVFAADMQHAVTYAETVWLPNYYGTGTHEGTASYDNGWFYSDDETESAKLSDVQPARNLSAIAVDDSGQITDRTWVSI